ncbi:ABC transporter ATP-binding protein/permease [uncultured Ferrimonas sp.]|uniref:ABC transporter ATP-binding protein/permease n=1 Tax=uncultured Ferrimonas sp. TaxID=432640 RepID=UPI00261A032E|nr:ABC transporter ATP-binding protein/permease [uncultured Ferrimonas sp.]
MQLLRQFWRLAGPYWCDRQNWFSWVLLGTSIAASMTMVEITVWLNEWNREFYDALAELKVDLIYPLLFEFCGLVAVIVLLVVYADWLAQLVQIRWRKWITEHLLGRWFDNGNYYRMTLGNEPDNPDQRIAEDARLLATDSVELFVGFIKSAAVLIAFASVLWELSGNIAIPWDGEQIHIAGYLFWVALIYAIVGTGITQLFGHRLHGLNFEQQRKEANFRASLLRKRDSAEQIALLKGERNERAQLNSSFADIVSNWRALMNRRKNLGLVVHTYHDTAKMVPLFAGIPAMMAEIITLGGLFQVRMAFMKVYAGFSWFVHSYDDLTRWSATVARLGQFLDEMDKQAPLPTPAQGDKLNCQQLDLFTPAGQPLLSNVDLTLPPQSQLLLSGVSGLGKSTLLRAFAGIWPFYQGELQLGHGQVMLMPQKPYLPTGSLRQCISYPSEQCYPDSDCRAALAAVGLSHLSIDLDYQCEWQQRLSGGEQQRLSLVRAILAQPDTLILDEATSSVDEAGASVLMQTLRQQLPEASILMVSHQRSLVSQFDNEVDLGRFSSAQPA